MNNRIVIRTLIVCFAGALVAAGCTQKQKQVEPPPPAPRIVSFTASESQVKAGSTVSLCWETKDATTVELRDAFKGVPSGFDGKPSGCVDVAVTEDTLFILTASNSRGVRDSMALSVQVVGAATDVVFIASPNRISAGESATLAWTAKGATQVSLATRDGQAIDIGDQKTSGSVTVSPTVATDYILTVDGEQHSTGIDVRPTIGAFVANAEGVKPGEMVSLSWQTTGATKVTLTRQGLGELVTETDPGKVADGSFSETVPTQIDSAEIFTYVLRAEGANKESVTTQTVTVYVAGAPAVTSFKVPEYVHHGGTVAISWTTTGATQVQVLRDDAVIYESPSLADAASGSLQVPAPAKDATFVLEASDGRGGVAVSDPMVVDPVGTPTVNSFTATPQPGIAQGGDAVTLSWDIPEARHLVIVAKGQYTLVDLKGMNAANGTWTAYPNKDTTYELVADNTLGDFTQPVTADVTVTTPAKLIFNPPSAPAGTVVQVTGSTVAGGGDVVGLPIVEQNPMGESFVDISGDGNDISSMQYSDNTAHVVTLSEVFQTRVYGVPVASDSINVSPNGWFAFQNTTYAGPDSVTTPLPSSALVPQAIAPYWDDLYISNGHVYWRIDGSGDNRRLIVQWDNVYEDTIWTRITLQAQVYASGKIVFAYKDLASAAQNANPSVGVVNSDETDALVLPNGVKPQTGDVFRFFGRATLPVSLTAPTSTFLSRVMIGTSNFIEIETTYPVIKPNDFKITEVNANPAVANGQWIELYNTTNDPIDLNGFTLDFGGGVTLPITQSVVLPPQAYTLIAQQPGAGDGLTTAFDWGTSLSLTAGQLVSIVNGATTFTSLAVPSTLPAAGYSTEQDSPAGMTFASGVSGLTCSAPASATYGTNGQHGTPGAANSPCAPIQYQGPITPNFESISATGTQLSFSSTDDAYTSFTAPVPITIDGTSSSTIWVSTNGFLKVGTSPGGSYYNNKTFPGTGSPVGTLAPYWDDLSISGGGGVWWQRMTPGLQPNDGYTIVSWEHVSDLAGSGESLNFQVKFFDDGRVEIHYGTMSGNLSPNSATQWWELPSGKGAYVLSISNSPAITYPAAFQFTVQ